MKRRKSLLTGNLHPKNESSLLFSVLEVTGVKAILMVLVSSGWHMMIFMIRSSTDGGTLAKTRLRCCFMTSRSTCFPIYVEWRKEKWAGKGKVQNESEELLDELYFDVFVTC